MLAHKFICRGFILALLLIIFSVPVLALEVPARPDHYVTDRANLLTAETETKLNAYLKNYEAKTTNQVVVVTFPSLEEESLEDFSIRLAETWRVGQKGRDNGVIFLIFKEDRKMRLEVGYGLEGTLPDALAGQIINNVVRPYFAQGEYEQGILAGVGAVIQATQGEFQASQGRYGRRVRRPLTPEEIEAMRRQGQVLGLIVLVLVGIFFIVDYFRYRTYVRAHQQYQKSYSFWEWWFRFAILLFVLSMLFRMMFYMMLFSRGGYYGSRGGFGGGFSGGGGSFGGGGASGGW